MPFGAQPTPTLASDQPDAIRTKKGKPPDGTAASAEPSAQDGRCALVQMPVGLAGGGDTLGNLPSALTSRPCPRQEAVAGHRAKALMQQVDRHQPDPTAATPGRRGAAHSTTLG